MSTSPKEGGEDSRDDADFEWKQIETAFKNDAFILLNGAIREELLSIYRSSAYAAQKEHSKFVIAWEAFAAKKGNDNDESFKSNPTKSISENIESFREYIRDEDLMQKEMKNVKKSSKKKVRSRFEKLAQKKQRVMTMGDALETHDFTEELPNVVVPVEEQKEDEPKTPFKETNNINNNISNILMKTPGSYRKSKKTNGNNNNNNTLMKTIFEGGLQENDDFVEQKLCSYTDETVDTNNNNNNIKKFFMRDRIEDKVAFLLNKKKNIIEEEEQEEQDEKVYGRVCSNPENNELHLESLTNGERIKLELRDVETNEYSLFPGQTVKCVGANPSGHCFVVKEIDCFPSHRVTKSTKIKRQETNMLIFSGPYTANDDLMYEPLDDVLHEAANKKNNVIILMGPFVSDENIKHALANNITYKQAFEEIVMKKIEAFAKQCPNKRVVLVPSVKDAFHRYCAFPQPPFPNQTYSSKCKNVHFVANPAAFEVNGVRVAASTCDILKHLSGFERGGKGKNTEKPQTDRMTRLCSHLVGQKSVYPLFPPHPDANFESHDATVPLRVGMDERVPDLIVLSSDLAAGGWKNALSGNKTMFVNPGKVCRGVNAGTFCKVSFSGGEDFADSARLELHKL